MAQIKQVGIGRKSTGTIDGITYYVRGGVTYARSAPNMPASAYNTPEAKLRAYKATPAYHQEDLYA